MIKTFDRSKHIAIQSNIFQAKKIAPQDLKGFKVDLNSPITETFIFQHNEKNKPQIVKEIYIPEEVKQEEENCFKKSIRVVHVEQEEKEKLQEQMDFENRIEFLLEKYNSEKRDAFETANMLTEEIFKYKTKKTQTLNNNRSSARSRVSEKKFQMSLDQDEQYKKNKLEVKRLYRQIKEVVQHILEGGGESKYRRYQQKQDNKDHITLEYIKQKQKQVEEIKSATDVQQLIRQFLSKKTDELKIFQQYHGDDFFSDPSIFRDLSDSFSETASVTSDKMSKIQEDLKLSAEDEKLRKFYNIEQLKIQWGVKSEHEVKENIRRILTREVLRDAERAKVKQEIEEQEIKQRLIKTDPRFARMFREEQKKKQDKIKQENQEREEKERVRKERFEIQMKKREQQELEQQKLVTSVRSQRRNSKQPFNPKREQENRVKKEFFDTAAKADLVYGDVFCRTKNFGDLFKTKAQEFYVSSPKNLSAPMDPMDVLSFYSTYQR